MPRPLKKVPKQWLKSRRRAALRASWRRRDQPTDIEALIAGTRAINGRIDFAVNNAGIGLKSMLADSGDDLWDQMNDVNLKSCFRIMRATLAIMREQGGGSIVNVSSMAGAVGLREAGVYAATKHAILGLTRTAAGENGDLNIRVNAIRSKLLDGTSPKVLKALLAPQAIKRLGEPEECGHLTAFLLSDKAAFITGACIPIDGGYLAN